MSRDGWLPPGVEYHHLEDQMPRLIPRENLPDEVELVEGYVQCDHYGDVHPNVADPFDEGPIRPLDLPRDITNELPEGWRLEDGLLHFYCPGPHYWLYAGAEIEEEEYGY